MNHCWEGVICLLPRDGGGGGGGHIDLGTPLHCSSFLIRSAIGSFVGDTSQCSFDYGG
jgi:hypothetical protein